MHDRQAALARRLAQALGLALACAGAVRAQTVDDPRLLVETWASGLTRPTCVTFLGKDDLLVFEKNSGRVLRVVNGTVVGTVLDLDVAIASSRGGLGIVADPGFATNHYIYVYYSAASGGDDGTWIENRLDRYTFDGSSLGNRFGPLVRYPFDPAQSNSSEDNSGVIRFGPDGKIYGQVGDLHRGHFDNPRVEQNTATAGSSSVGGIFRINPDGSIPSDNPFVGEADARLRPWFVYGFRNSFGMDFDRLTGKLWFSENGPTSYDEINRAERGMNSGWLKIMGPDARNATYDENGNAPYDADDLTMLSGAVYRDPEFSWKDCLGVAAVCFLDSKRFPEDLQNILLVGEQNNEQLYAFHLDAARQHFVLSGGLADRVADTPAERDALRFAADMGTTPDMHIGPDGYLYTSDYYNGRIHRIRPITELHEPEALQVVQGRVLSGGLAELERSDNARLELVIDHPGAAPSAAIEVVTTFLLERDDPVRLDLVVETRGNVRGAIQDIEILHVPSGTWRSLDRRPLQSSDRSITLGNLPDPGSYVRPADHAVLVRIRHEADHAASGLGPSLHTGVDQVRLLVTLP